MDKILSIITVIPSLALSFFGALLKFVNEGIKPITDETKTNKDNIIQEKVSAILVKIIAIIGKLQTWLNIFNRDK